jgi:hypothetical protein
MTNISKQLIAVYVIPEHSGRQNVIHRVLWSVKYERDGFSSNAMVETFLDISAIDQFIPANEVGNERVLQWAFDAQGGDDFIARIQSHHEDQIDYAASIAGHVLFFDGFETLTPPVTPQIPSAVL